MTGPGSCPGAPAVQLAEANVLMDYCKSGNRAVLSLVAEQLRPLVVVSTVFDEVRELDADECANLGIRIVEATAEQLDRADCGGSPVSFSDRVGLVVCRDEGWTCVTNDRALRGLCEQLGVPVRFGLSLLVDLTAAGAITRRRAGVVARRIHSLNPNHIDDRVLRRFLLGLDRAARN